MHYQEGLGQDIGAESEKATITWCHKCNGRVELSDYRSTDENPRFLPSSAEGSQERPVMSWGAGLVSRAEAQGEECRWEVVFLTCSRGKVSLAKTAACGWHRARGGRGHAGHHSGSALGGQHIRWERGALDLMIRTEEIGFGWDKILMNFKPQQ